MFDRNLLTKPCLLTNFLILFHPNTLSIIGEGETLSGVTQLKIRDICLFVYVWMYVCHFVL